MKKLLTTIFLASFVYFIIFGIGSFTDKFKVSKISLTYPYTSEWETFPLIDEEELSQILDQKFTYLDKGTQFYVFESEDQKYVLKFLRYDRIRPTLLEKVLEKTFSKQAKGFKEEVETRVNKTHHACLLAYQNLPEETGLLYVHLNYTKDLPNSFFLRDKIGRKHKINLNEMRFCIQRKVLPLASTLIDLKKRGAKKEIFDVLDAFFYILSTRSEKGIANRDPNTFQNFGFLDGKIIEIDFGDYEENPALVHPQLFDAEIMRYVNRLRDWLTNNMPEMVEYLDKRVEEVKKT